MYLYIFHTLVCVIAGSAIVNLFNQDALWGKLHFALCWETEGVMDARLEFITHSVRCVNGATDEPQRATWGNKVSPHELVEKQLVVDKIWWWFSS